MSKSPESVADFMGKLDAKIENLGGWRHVQKLYRENYAEFTNCRKGKASMESLGAERQRMIRHLLKTEKRLTLGSPSRISTLCSASRISTLLAAEGCRNPSTGESWGVRTISRDLAEIEKQDAANAIFGGILRAST